ncbi:MAG: TonB-dependent receptor [Chitinophagaceae bacterium]|nr:TonB-dependent receptor [Chitinophagaceae bacterium]
MISITKKRNEVKRLVLFFGLFITTVAALSQTKVVVKTVSSGTGDVVQGVSIALNGKSIKSTDANGLAVLQLANEKSKLSFSAVGFKTQDTTLVAPFPDTLLIQMISAQKELEEVTVVSSTRNNQRIENSPLKVEVLGREEMEEESTIKPAGIASILGDVSGVQIQQSSAINGNSNVRIQGLDGRYTQILKDGMPLYDGFSGGFGILSIPPLDLKQAELIKGSASTLYGGGAIGGLINIISRKPTAKQEAVFSINQTTLKETNYNTFLSRKDKKVGYTFFGGYNYQKAVDVNKDGFSDLSDLKGLVLHPRFFFYPDHKTTVVVGYTGTFEKRNGGDMQVLAGKADATHQYFENNTINRNSWELTAQRNLANNRKLEFKSSLSSFKRRILNNQVDFTGRQTNYYTELSAFLPHNANNLVVGVNATGDQFTKLTNTIPLNNFHNNTVGVFAQESINLQEHTNIEIGLRNDYHFTYGNFILPRLAIFHRINEHWATRAGIGFGYKAPNALAAQNTDFEIQKITSLPSTIKAEKSVGYNAEINYKVEWGVGNELFINQAFFLTQLTDPVVATAASNGDVSFQNQSKPILTRGSDTYVKALVHEWELYVGYTFTVAERKYLTQNQFIPLTPKHRFAFTIVRDFEEEGFRFGLEGSYNGFQYREDYTKTPGYFFMAAMVEKKFGSHISLVLNGENLLDYRQSKVESLYTGTVTNPTFKSLWAPIDGRVLNLSIRWKF